MQTSIRKKSLYYSLEENRTKVKQTTQWLIAFSLAISIVTIVLAFLFFNNEYKYIMLFIAGSAIYLCYTIFSLWYTRKKIKQKLKSLDK
jgi:membrane protein YdbS with pleckstrin-like domain